MRMTVAMKSEHLSLEVGSKMLEPNILKKNIIQNEKIFEKSRVYVVYLFLYSC